MPAAYIASWRAVYAAGTNGSRPLVLSQGVSAAEWTTLCDTMRQEWEQVHSNWPFYMAYGQHLI